MTSRQASFDKVRSKIGMDPIWGVDLARGKSVDQADCQSTHEAQNLCLDLA